MKKLVNTVYFLAIAVAIPGLLWPADKETSDPALALTAPVGWTREILTYDTLAARLYDLRRIPDPAGRISRRGALPRDGDRLG